MTSVGRIDNGGNDVSAAERGADDFLRTLTDKIRGRCATPNATFRRDPNIPRVIQASAQTLDGILTKQSPEPKISKTSKL